MSDTLTASNYGAASPTVRSWRTLPGSRLGERYVGCGEGADAVWLARNGWDVTALEVSGLALERAAGHANEAGVAVRWLHAELAQAPLEPASFDLVSAQYPALLRTPDSTAERALLSAVAPDGLLLLVHHAGMDIQQASDSGFDPADYVWPSTVASCSTTTGR